MFHRLRFGNKKQVITEEQIQRKEEAERLREEAKKELAEAQVLANALRAIRVKNHFAEGFRKSLGGTGGTS